MTSTPRNRFGEVAVSRNFITQAQLDLALARQHESGGEAPLGDVLVELGFITPSQVSAILKLQRILEAPADDPGGTVVPRGEILGGCMMLEPIARGAMGTTYKAHHLKLDRDVAVKVLHKDLVRDRRTVERFTREARAAAKLEHHGIVQVYDFDEAGAWTFIVMQLVDGKSLREVLDQRGPLGAKRACWVGAKVAEALAAAHALGIVHRDVKPANVLVSKTGMVKLADFGLVRHVDTGADTTGVGELIGTPVYMSPEQAQGELEIDGRTDVYALGIMLFELACGKPPFEADGLVALLKKQILEPLPSLRRRAPDAPRELDELLRRATAKRREDRPDAATVARELRELYERAFGASEESGRLRPIPPETAPKGQGTPPAGTHAPTPPALAIAPGPRPPRQRGQTGFYDVADVREAASLSLIARALDGDLPGALRDLARLDDRAVRELGGRVLEEVAGAGRVDEILRVQGDLRALSARAPSLLFHLARALQARGKLPESAAVLEEAALRDPDDVEVAHERATILAALGRRSEAADVANGLLARRPADPLAHRRMGEVRWIALGDLPGAAAALGRAADLEPGAFEPRQKQGFLLLEMARAAEARRVLEDAVARAPDSALARTLLGRALSLCGDEPGSRAAFARALELDPSASEPRQALVEAALSERRFVDAARLAADGLARAPRERDLLLALAAAREGLGEADTAARLYGEVLALAPESARAKAGLRRCRKGT